MGNINSVRPPKIQKDRKTEGHGSADTGKGRRSVNGNDKAAAGSSTRKRDFGRHHHVDVRATNPFIIFFLRLRSKKPKEPVTVVARAAGKLWGRMSPKQRKKYVDLANAEKKRRQERKRRRKHSARSR